MNLLNVINTQTFVELIHELLKILYLLNILYHLNILYLLNILYTAFLINPTLIAFVLFTLLGLVAFLSRVLIMMIILLLFLQKQNLAFAVYLLGSVLSLPD